MRTNFYKAWNKAVRGEAFGEIDLSPDEIYTDGTAVDHAQIA